METLVQIYANNPSVPHNNEQPSIIKLNAAFIVFTDSIIILRILVRARIVKHIATEDYLMVAAGLFATAFSAMNIVGKLTPQPVYFPSTNYYSGTRHGLGRHIYDLPQMTLIENVKKVIQTLWVSQVLYATALSLVKISIIASFHRIFPTKPLRWTMYSLGGLILAVWIVNIFTTLFQCSPIYAAWDFQAIKPKCLPIMKVYYFSTAFSILTDVLLCVLPLPFLWKLKLPLREKYIVSALFGFGLFAAVASIMRITVLHNVQSADVTIATVPALNWSVVEVGTGIICACVPCLKPLFKKLLPGRFFSNAHPSRNGGLSRDAHGPAEGAEMRRMSRPAAIAKVGSMKSARSTVRTREFV
ncbi:uncharacterized protein HMPREF1541_07832 [Cyphellophora europaea CBS 101466]|uniref:Rhodopsin domain-containing protein n=1 Tax=Cyphellophora europaea (strain CBS 101466) TaxID=1220924 RepID=W2RKJ3_CYPE1|nr:uncharacterized protein HMPREF1541_07832 [Cyphellophora europaea CBS 101466]ETN36845.1 hypothetical protein HMPREF1541_07832 [Cyphellophora europaea CBS 101466]